MYPEFNQTLESLHGGSTESLTGGRGEDDAVRIGSVVCDERDGGPGGLLGSRTSSPNDEYGRTRSHHRGTDGPVHCEGSFRISREEPEGDGHRVAQDRCGEWSRDRNQLKKHTVKRVQTFPQCHSSLTQLPSVWNSTTGPETIPEVPRER